MVLSIEEIDGVENKSELAGHMAVLLGEYEAAQELFLLSTRPELALEMQRDRCVAVGGAVVDRALSMER